LSEPAYLANLIAAVARGDTAAFDSLYESVSPKLFGLILRMVRTRPLAEDILQDVFVRIWTKAATYTPGAGEPMAWMASVARHRAIDALRARPALRQVEEPYENWLENIADPRDGEGQMMDASILHHCLETLDETTRACVVQAYCEGFSGLELAARHGKPVNTIKSQLRRGLAALKDCVEQNG